MNIDYTKYTAEEIASELSFIQYVKNNNQVSSEQWQNYIRQNPAEKEKIHLAKDIVVQALESDFNVQSEQIEHLWKRIDQATTEQSIGKIRSLRWIPYSVAAGLLLLLGFYFLWPAVDMTQLASHDKLLPIELPDQSQVVLNSGSNLEYKDKRWKRDRIVNLNGEAFFQVRKGSRFLVTTSIGNVQVLGTSFNVYARGKTFEVKCMTGKVAVSWKGGEILLHPGELFHSDRYNTKDNVGRFKVENYKDWRQGWFEYQQRPLSEVFSELERQFRINIKDQNNHGPRLYNGFFENKSLDSALFKICWPMNIEYEIQGNTVIVK